MKTIQNLVLAALCISFVTSCAPEPEVIIPTPKEFVQFGFVHAAIDVPAVDVTLDGVKRTTTPLAYGGATNYFESELKTGVDTKLDIAVVGGPTLSESFKINSATQAKSLGIGYLTVAYVDSNTARTPRLLTFANTLTPPTGVNAKINIVHLVPDNARTKLDVRYVAVGGVASNTSPTIATGVEFAKKTEFIEIPSGKYDLKFLKGGTLNLFVSPAGTSPSNGQNFDAVAGGIYTIVMRGNDAGVNEKNVKITTFQHK